MPLIVPCRDDVVTGGVKSDGVVKITLLVRGADGPHALHNIRIVRDECVGPDAGDMACMHNQQSANARTLANSLAPRRHALDSHRCLRLMRKENICMSRLVLTRKGSGNLETWVVANHLLP